MDLSLIPVVLLAGGEGMKLEGQKIPKAMAPIKGLPMIYYVVEHYRRAGFKKFIVCAGEGKELVQKAVDGFKFGADITVVDTGKDNRTGSRLAQVRQLVNGAPFFSLTYCDTLCDVNLERLVDFHIRQKKAATMLATHMPTRFRILGITESDHLVRGFADQPILLKDYINGGYYFFSRKIFDEPSLTAEAGCTLETDVLEALAAKKELVAFQYKGFWQNLDSDKDSRKLASWVEKQKAR